MDNSIIGSGRGRNMKALKVNTERTVYANLLRDKDKRTGVKTINVPWNDKYVVYQDLELQEADNQTRTGVKTGGTITTVTRAGPRGILTLAVLGHRDTTGAVEL